MPTPTHPNPSALPTTQLTTHPTTSTQPQHSRQVAAQYLSLIRLINAPQHGAVHGQGHVHQAEGHIAVKAEALRPQSMDGAQDGALVDGAADEGDVGMRGRLSCRLLPYAAASSETSYFTGNNFSRLRRLEASRISIPTIRSSSPMSNTTSSASCLFITVCF